MDYHRQSNYQMLELLRQTLNSLKINGPAVTFKKIYLYFYVYIFEVRLHYTSSFLKKVAGVIHIGANEGQERFEYAKHGLNVIWVEPIPNVFKKLNSNLENFPKQRALNLLITADDKSNYEFKVSNFDGGSSSIFDLAGHAEIWPSIHYVESINLKGHTLSSVITEHGIEIADYQALVMDVQGAELMVLIGAEKILKCFKYIKLEASDFELYAGGCLLEDLTNYLYQHGFIVERKIKFAEQAGKGNCFNVLYRNTSST